MRIASFITTFSGFVLAGCVAAAAQDTPSSVPDDPSLCRELVQPLLDEPWVVSEAFDPDAAIGACRAELSDSPGDPGRLAYLAMALAEAGQWDAMLDAAQASADAGHPVGQWFMGRINDLGFGRDVDMEQAASWYRAAAEQGDARAQLDLGQLYENGEGVTLDMAEAARWYLAAAEQGNARAQFSIAWLYDNGDGVPLDDEAAVRWYRAAAEQGYATSQTNLGVMYQYGEGVTQNDEEAARWYLAAAEGGDAQGQANLAGMYEDGRGVAQDDAEAVRWYRAAAEQGNARAQNTLGFRYERGQGVEQDDEEAVRWYTAAAEQGNAQAQFNLGWMYDNGRGVAEDDEEAARWYREAAEQGNARAQFGLAWLYDNGEVVPLDDKTAVYWYRAAAEQGNPAAQSNLGVMYENGEGVEQSYEAAVLWYRAAAEQGHALGQYHLGRMYDDGTGVPLDDAEAVRWYRMAAEQGNANAQNTLGVMYEDGEGVEEDDEEAVRWYTAAAEQGNAQAQFNLARMYDNGTGVALDDAEAVRWYRAAAEQGHVTAQVDLGIMYENGEGVEASDEEAARWYRAAAEQGNAKGQFNLAWLYDNGRGVPENAEEATRWYLAAAEQGHVQAQFNLAWNYDNGHGVPENDEEAVRWYRTAAEQGHESAQTNLGVAYEYGEGVEQSDEEALRWYAAAAEQGNAQAQFNLGWMYDNGRGVPEDDEVAVEWYRKAAEQGHASAQTNLGVMYRNGEGVEASDEEALRWYSAAAEQGNLQAKLNIGWAYVHGTGVDPDLATGTRWLIEGKAFDAVADVLTTSDEAARLTALPEEIVTTLLTTSAAFEDEQLLSIISHWADRDPTAAERLWRSFVNRTSGPEYYDTIRYRLDADQMLPLRPLLAARADEGDLWARLLIAELPERNLRAIAAVADAGRDSDADLYWTAWARLFEYLGETVAAGNDPADELGQAAAGDPSSEVATLAAWTGLLGADEAQLPLVRDQFAAALEESPIAALGASLSEFRLDPANTDQAYRYFETALRPDINVLEPVFQMFDQTGTLDGLDYFLTMADFGLAREIESGAPSDKADILLLQLDHLAADLDRDRLASVLDRNFQLALARDRGEMAAQIVGTAFENAAVCANAQDILCLDPSQGTNQGDRTLYLSPASSVPADLEGRTCPEVEVPKVRYIAIGDTGQDLPGRDPLERVGNDISLILSAAEALGAESKPLRLMDLPSAAVFKALREVVSDTPCGTTVWLHLSGPGASWPYGMILADGDPDVIESHQIEQSPNWIGSSPSSVASEAPRVYVENSTASGVLSPREIGAFVDALRLRSNDVVVSIDIDQAGEMDIGQWVAGGAPLEVVDFSGPSNWTVQVGKHQQVPEEATPESGEPRLGDATIIVASDFDDVKISDCDRGDNTNDSGGCLPRSYGAMTYSLARALLKKEVVDPESLSRALEDFDLDVGDHEIEFISTNPPMRIVPGHATPKESLEVEINGLEPVERGSRGALRLVTDEPVYHIAGRIKDLTLPDVLLLDGKAVNLGSDGRFSDEIPLDDVTHELRIVAVFPDSSVRLRTISISYTGDPNQLLSRGNYYALLIANTDYQNDDAWPDLDTPDDDVRDVAEVLKNEFGFKTELSVSGKTVNLVVYNATKPQILQRLSLLRKVLTDRDRLLVYYAGHGYIDPDRDDRAFWIPVEGSGDLLEDYTWLNSREVKDQIAKIPAKHILIVADSCFSGGFARSGDPEEDARLREQNERARQKYLAEMASHTSRMILSSGDLEQVSDGTGEGHSPFAEAFLEGLETINHPAFAGSDLYYSKIKERVTGTSNQRPQYVPLSDSGHEGGDFVFQRTDG